MKKEANFFYQDVPIKKRTPFFNKLFFHYEKKWETSFSLMLFLGVGVATMGLSQNSAAVVIGSMLIVPLSAPIVALGGAIALGWRKQSFRMIVIVIIGTVGSILTSYIIGLILPDLTPNQQILIRTSPDLRDLAIAILAGFAGAYGYYRSQSSTILSGVAIAVSLIPPLCVSGIMLAQGHFILANGSLLLFFTNFIGTTFAAILTFFILGLKNNRSRKWFYKGTISIIILVAIIIFPLASNYQKFNSRIKFYSSIYEKVGEVIKLSANSPTIKGLSIQGTGVVITIQPFPSDKNEEQRLKNELERVTGLQVFLKRSSIQQ